MLTEKYRPKKIDEVVGQVHLLGDNGILRKIIEKRSLKNLICFGPSGTGKTTIAKIIADSFDMEFHSLNAVTASVNDIKKIADAAEKSKTKALIYLDEIQYFNKKQQQALLPFIESGVITLIASTTENPYHYIYDALRSRCLLIEFKSVSSKDILKKLKEISKCENRDIPLQSLEYICKIATGDVRSAINILDTLFTTYEINDISIEDIQSIIPSFNQAGFDKDGNTHYDLPSGLQKSIRGSDPDAACYYLARLLEGGDLLSPCRRLLVIANEDVGLAYPQAMSIAYAATESAKQLGLPEGRIPLGNLAVFLALCPKSNSTHVALDSAIEDIRSGKGVEIPEILKSPYKGYKYPHNYPNAWVKQEYLPKDLKGSKYYKPGDNKWENRGKLYWDEIKKK